MLLENENELLGESSTYIKRLMFLLVKNPKIIIEIIRKNN
jgi:hypothetical protein